MIPQRIKPFFTIFLIIIFSLLSSCDKKCSSIKRKDTTEYSVQKHINLANNLLKENKLNSAYYQFNKAKINCNPQTDPEKFVFCISNMANIQQMQGDYVGSEATATEAIPYLQNIKDHKYTWRIYVTLGVNYIYTYDYENSLVYHDKAYNLNTNKRRKLSVKNNIALVYVEQKKFQKAIKIYESLLNEKEILTDTIMYPRVLDNLGEAYFLTKNPKAIIYLEQGAAIRLKQKDNFGLGASYIHLASYYEKTNPSLSKKYAELAYKRYTLVQSIDDRLKCLELIIKNSKNQELKEKSLLYIRLTDSINEVRQKSKNQFARLRYDSKKEKEENLKLKNQSIENQLLLERQLSRNFISYLVIGFSIVLLLLLYYYLTIKGRKDKNDATYNSETRIAKKLHDELANDVYHTMAFAENKNLSLAENKELLLSSLDTIYNRTRNISKENSIIITDKNYALYLKEMISGFNNVNTTILLNGLNNIDWDSLERNKKITIYRVLQELLVNMKKHSNATLVGITFKECEKNLIVNYNDNGQGININKMILKNGLHNVENRIYAVKGTIDFDSTPNKGFKVFFKISL